MGTKIIPAIIQAIHPGLNREPKSAKHNPIQENLRRPITRKPMA